MSDLSFVDELILLNEQITFGDLVKLNYTVKLSVFWG